MAIFVGCLSGIWIGFLVFWGLDESGVEGASALGWAAGMLVYFFMLLLGVLLDIKSELARKNRYLPREENP